MRSRPAPTTQWASYNSDSRLRASWSLLRGNRLISAIQTALSFIEGASEAAILTVFARLALSAVDAERSQVYVPGIREQSVSTTMLVLVFLIILRLVAALLVQFLSGRVARRLVSDLRSEAVRHFTSASWRAQTQLDNGALQHLVVSLPTTISGHLISLIQHCGQISIMISMLLYALLTDVTRTSALVIVIVCATIGFRPLRALIKRKSAAAVGAQRELSSAVAEMGNLKFEAAVFGVREQVSKPVSRAIDRESRLQERVHFLKGAIVPIYTTITFAAVTVGLVMLSVTPSENLEQTGPILLVVLRSLSYGSALQSAASNLASLVPALDFMEKALGELRNFPVQHGSITLERIDSIEFDSVTFTYQVGEDSALSEATFKILTGTKVGVVGRSGGGKSTAVKLTLGLLEPDIGNVLVNGRNLRDFRVQDWSDKLGVVPQSSVVMQGTVAQNLRFFRSGISDEDLWWALEVSNFAKDVEEMPEGLNTMLGQTHRELSGGQQQRLAIARAIVGRPAIIVMDEPTSSLDATSEALVSDAISQLPGNLTTIVVSHRRRILEGCDQIILLEEGRVVKAGTPSLVLDDVDLAT